MSEKRSRSAPAPIKRPFLNSRMPLSYTEWPNDGAPILILIHGNRDHSRSWDALAKSLRSEYHIIAPDLRGHGDSGWAQDGRYEFAAYLSDMGALAQELRLGPQRQAVLIGHSLGAHIALRFTAVYPDKVSRVVAIEAVGAPPAIEARRLSQPIQTRMRDWLEERHEASLTEPRSFASIDEAVDRMRARHSFLTPGQAQQLTHHGLKRAAKSGWQWKHDPFLAIWPFPDIPPEEARALWRHISCPALLIYGDRSWPSGVPADLLRSLPDVREVRLAESGHWPQHDAFGACRTAIETFLAE